MNERHPVLQEALRLNNEEDDPDQARHLLEQAVEAGVPRSLWAYGTFLASWGTLDEAERILRRSLKRGEEGAEMALAGVLTDMDRIDEARAVLLPKAVAGVPDFALSLADVLAEDEDRHAEAEHWYQRALNEGDWQAANNYAVFLDNLGRTDEAKPYFLRAIDAGDTKALANYALSLKNEGQSAQAVPLLERAVAQEEHSALLILAEIWEEQEDLTKAEECYRKAMTHIVPESLVEYAKFLSRIEGREDDTDAAFTEAINKRDLDAHWEYGLYLEEQGNSDAAAEQYRLALQDGQTDAHLNLAIHHEKLGELTEAEHHYQASLDAGDPTTPLNYAQFLRDTNASPERIQAVLQRARIIGTPTEELAEIERLLGRRR